MCEGFCLWVRAARGGILTLLESKRERKVIRKGWVDCGGWAGVLFVVGYCSGPLPHVAVVFVLIMLLDLHFIFPFSSSNPSSQICSASPVGDRSTAFLAFSRV